MGEAYYLRGMMYFVLNRFWAQPQNDLSVILQLEPFDPEDKFPRSSIAEVKNQVIQDLQQAESLLEGFNFE